METFYTTQASTLNSEKDQEIARLSSQLQQTSTAKQRLDLELADLRANFEREVASKTNEADVLQLRLNTAMKDQ